jgi:MFS transporter, DHA2 family, multidrug resistance protein
LLPPYLQDLGHYSVMQTGLLMTPRGIGTMLVMMIAGRLTRIIDPRLLMGVGVIFIAGAMWDMTRWTPEIGLVRLAIVSMIQGAGISFVFIPLQVVGFATLAPSLRTDAAALYSLSRNIGSAIGVSATATLLSSSFQTIHSQLAEQITPFNRALQSGAQGLFMGPVTPFGIQGAEAQIQYHAYVAAYANDFMLMFWTCLPLLPLLFFMRKPKAQKVDVAELAID